MKHVLPVLYLSAAMAWTVATVVACESSTPSQAADAGAEAPTPLAEVALESPPPVLPRLTQEQYRSSLRDFFGPDVVLPASLEPDMVSAGLAAIGVGVAATSPRGVEQYFNAARSVAAQALASPDVRARIVTCAPAGPTDEACLQEILGAWGRRIWRRPLAAEELEAVVALAVDAASTLDGDFDAGVEYGLATLLTAPSFLYRAELGEDDPDRPGVRRYTSWEMASRLSFLLWNRTPDDALLDAAERGTLVTDEGLAAEVDRLLASDRAREGVRAFFAQWLHLHELDDLNKDPTVFKHFSAELGAMAREETLRVIEHHVFDLDADYRDLFTTRTTFATRRLAAIYNVPATMDEGFGEITLPEDGPRAGILGHVSFLALHSHPVASSATLRGLFVRETILCSPVPSPPSNLNTAIPEPSADALTLRDRLTVHMEDPVCAACHSVTDPVGLGFEQFDGIGRYRLTENAAPIDPTGILDGEPYADGRALGALISRHPQLPACLVETVHAYATGRAKTVGEVVLIDAMTARFVDDGHKVVELFRTVATSPGFRQVGEVQ